MKIICIGSDRSIYKNNIENNLSEETGTESEIPLIYFKPDSALLSNNKPFFIPDFSTEIYSEVKLVIKINRLGKNIAGRFAARYYDEISVGIDLSAMNIRKKLVSNNYPWELSTAFDNSAIVGNFITKDTLLQNSKSILMLKNDQKCGIDLGNDIISRIDETIAFLSTFFTLKIGDLIFLDIGLDKEKIAINDVLKGQIADKELLSVHIL